MRFFPNDFSVTIDFERADAMWSLLVIDDMWDSVKEMICGEYDVVTGSKLNALGEKSIDKSAVEALWSSKNPREAIYERTLWLLPWMMADIEDFRAVTFCGFPGNETRLKIVIEEARKVAVHADTFIEQCAVLIDVSDKATGTQRLDETWHILNGLDFPTYSRAIFSRAAEDMPEWTDSVEMIPKAAPKGRLDAIRQHLRSWLGRVRGTISGELYQRLTHGCCHNPTDLLNTSADTRREICSGLAGDEFYGVWRWCAEEASVEQMPPTAPNRWLASKAFQTTPANSPAVPVTAVIAICEGAKYLVPDKGWCYTVDSGLYQITRNEVGVPVHRLQINSLDTLGCIELAHGDYGTFAVALRQWLIQPEQFDQGQGRLSGIRIDTDNEKKQARLKMTYTEKIPEKIFNRAENDRRGRIGGFWDNLVKFAAGYSHDNQDVLLSFTWLE